MLWKHNLYHDQKPIIALKITTKQLLGDNNLIVKLGNQSTWWADEVANVPPIFQTNIWVAGHHCGVHVSQADGRLLLLDVQALGFFAGGRNSGYCSCHWVPQSTGYQWGPDRVWYAEVGQTISKKVAGAMKKVQDGRLGVQIPLAAKLSLTKSLLNNTCCNHCIHADVWDV